MKKGKHKPMTVSSVTVRLTPEQDKGLAAVVGSNGYKDMSDFIRQAIDLKLRLENLNPEEQFKRVILQVPLDTYHRLEKLVSEGKAIHIEDVASDAIKTYLFLGLHDVETYQKLLKRIGYYNKK
jgi:Arc/MetJ-type ribon-helix-helix transcriptional regulator